MGRFFGKKNKKKVVDTSTPLRLKGANVDFNQIGDIVKPINYDVKILVAWGEAISGNEKIRHWLMKNGYTELGMFCFALRNELSAQTWLLQNGYPHLLALIKGIEGDAQARNWLKQSGNEILWYMSVAADGDPNAKRFLMMKDKVYAGLAMKMGRLKDDIEWNNNSYYNISP